MSKDDKKPKYSIGDKICGLSSVIVDGEEWKTSKAILCFRIDSITKMPEEGWRYFSNDWHGKSILQKNVKRQI